MMPANPKLHASPQTQGGTKVFDSREYAKLSLFFYCYLIIILFSIGTKVHLLLPHTVFYKYLIYKNHVCRHIFLREEFI